MGQIYNKVIEFKKKYPKTIAWRLKENASVVEKYINDDEKIIYAFCGQKNDKWYDIFSTCVVVLTNKRLLIGQKRVIIGSIFNQVTPDLYNDMQIYTGLFFGTVTIDTAKEIITITNLSKDSLDDIETHISKFMMEAKTH